MRIFEDTTGTGVNVCLLTKLHSDYEDGNDGRRNTNIGVEKNDNEKSRTSLKKEGRI